MSRIFIIGAGGFGREILDIFTDLGRENDVRGFLEENCNREGELIHGKPVYDFSILEDVNRNETRLVCAIGTPLRKRLIEKSVKMGFKFETLIHPSVIMSKWVRIGQGCIICAGCILTNNIKLGNYTILNLNCIIGHDVSIDDYSTISPGVNVSGFTSIGESSFIGVGVNIVDRLSVGDNSFIGAGSLVSKNVPDDVFALGMPARALKKITTKDWENFPNIKL